jgi:hypothetical protein
MYALPARSGQPSPLPLHRPQPILPADRTEKFGTHAGARFALFDIDRTAEPQGIAPGSLDLILASNVLHNALDLDASLSYLGSLLAGRPAGAVRGRAKKGCNGLPWLQCWKRRRTVRHSIAIAGCAVLTSGSKHWAQADTSPSVPILPRKANGLRRPASVGGPVEQGCRGM